MNTAGQILCECNLELENDSQTHYVSIIYKSMQWHTDSMCAIGFPQEEIVHAQVSYCLCTENMLYFFRVSFYNYSQARLLHTVLNLSLFLL